MCFMSNPAGGNAEANMKTDNAMGAQYNAQAGQANDQLFPFLSSEVSNPHGFGDTAVNEMKTTGGEAVAGAQGQATEAAQLLGSRTGNTAAAPGIIDAASRNAMKQNSTNAMNVDLANNTAKLTQQQAGASGLGSTYSTDVNAALHALGLSNDAVKTQASQPGLLDFLKFGTGLGQTAFNDYETANAGAGSGGGGGGGAGVGGG